MKIDLVRGINALKDGEPIPVTYTDGNSTFGRLSLRETRKDVLSALSENGVGFIDITEFFCDENTCRLWVDKPGDVPLLWDNTHLTLPAIKALGRYIADRDLLFSGVINSSEAANTRTGQSSPKLPVSAAVTVNGAETLDANLQLL